MSVTEEVRIGERRYSSFEKLHSVFSRGNEEDTHFWPGRRSTECTDELLVLDIHGLGSF